MTTLTFNMTREQVAEYLGVSTRTIDRYVKRWKLSYKKIANKVLLAKEEVDLLQDDFDLLRQEGVAIEGNRERVVTERSVTTSHSGARSEHVGSVKEFVDVLEKKDKSIEEKNQMIFLLQRKIGEMEAQMKHMIALPDHTSEKEDMFKSMQQLEMQKLSLEDQIRKERMMNIIFIGLALLAVAILVFFTIQ